MEKDAPRNAWERARARLDCGLHGVAVERVKVNVVL
jgi:hypothetical protein